MKLGWVVSPAVQTLHFVIVAVVTVAVLVERTAAEEAVFVLPAFAALVTVPVAVLASVVAATAVVSAQWPAAVAAAVGSEAADSQRFALEADFDLS